MKETSIEAVGKGTIDLANIFASANSTLAGLTLFALFAVVIISQLRGFLEARYARKAAADMRVAAETFAKVAASGSETHARGITALLVQIVGMKAVMDELEDHLDSERLQAAREAARRQLTEGPDG